MSALRQDEAGQGGSGPLPLSPLSADIACRLSNSHRFESVHVQVIVSCRINMQNMSVLLASANLRDAFVCCVSSWA